MGSHVVSSVHPKWTIEFHIPYFFSSSSDNGSRSFSLHHSTYFLYSAFLYISYCLRLYVYDPSVVAHWGYPVLCWFALLCLRSASLVCSRWFVCDSCFCTWPTPIAFAFATVIRPVFYCVLFHFILSRILWQFSMNWQRLSLRESVLEYQGFTPSGVIGTWRYQNLYRGFQCLGDCSLYWKRTCALVVSAWRFSYRYFTWHLTSYCNGHGDCSLRLSVQYKSKFSALNPFQLRFWRFCKLKNCELGGSVTLFLSLALTDFF